MYLVGLDLLCFAIFTCRSPVSIDYIDFAYALHGCMEKRISLHFFVSHSSISGSLLCFLVSPPCSLGLLVWQRCLINVWHYSSIIILMSSWSFDCFFGVSCCCCCLPSKYSLSASAKLPGQVGLHPSLCFWVKARYSMYSLVHVVTCWFPPQRVCLPSTLSSLVFSMSQKRKNDTVFARNGPASSFGHSMVIMPTSPRFCMVTTLLPLQRPKKKDCFSPWKEKENALTWNLHAPIKAGSADIGSSAIKHDVKQVATTTSTTTIQWTTQPRCQHAKGCRGGKEGWSLGGHSIAGQVVGQNQTGKDEDDCQNLRIPVTKDRD